MVRAHVDVSKPEEAMQAYEIIDNIPAFEIISVKEQLSMSLRRLVLRVSYSGRVIGEI